MKKLILSGLISALGEAAYIALVALFMQFAGKMFEGEPKVLGTIAFLMLFVLSTAVSGALILGRPVMLYLGNNKREALQLFIITLGWIFVFLIILFSILLLRK